MILDSAGFASRGDHRIASYSMQANRNYSTEHAANPSLCLTPQRCSLRVYSYPGMLQVFSLMTCFTHCYHDILYTPARAERGRESNRAQLGRGAGCRGERWMCGNSGTVRDAGEPGAGESGGGVPG